MAISKIRLSFEGTPDQWKAVHDALPDTGITGAFRVQIRRDGRAALQELRRHRVNKRGGVAGSAAELGDIDSDIAAIDAALPDFPE